MAKTYNTIPTVSTGDVYTATAHNNIVTNVNNYRVPPSCSVRATTARAFSAGGFVTWDTDSGSGSHDTDDMWDAGDPTKVVIRTPGIYQVSFSLFINSDPASAGSVTSSHVILAATLGGGVTTTYVAGNTGAGMNSDASSFASGAYIGQFVADDYIQLGPLYINGTSTNLKVGPTYTHLAATWLGQVS